MEQKIRCANFTSMGHEYCKYKNQCKRKHFSIECEELNNCKNIKSCDNKHQEQSKVKDKELVNETVKVLEKVVEDLSLTVFCCCLQTELADIKNKKKYCKS